MRRCIVIAGVAGVGKSTLGAALAVSLELPFVDADDLHSAAAISKMSRGVPLDEDDRAPWLVRVAAVLADVGRYPRGVVVACSALKAEHRALLRDGGEQVVVLFLEAPRAVLSRRIEGRRGHFMSVDMLQSQLDALERPSEDEQGVVLLDAGLDFADLLSAAAAAVKV